MRKICGLFAFLLIFSSVLYASEKETFYMSGILWGAKSSSKKLYLDQGEGHKTVLSWDKKTIFCDLDGKKISVPAFIEHFKGQEVEAECVEKKKVILLIRIERLNKEY